MKFYFCETCGKRITENEIEEGFGKDKKLKGIYCMSCVVTRAEVADTWSSRRSRRRLRAILMLRQATIRSSQLRKFH